MIFGVGTDLVPIERMERILRSRQATRFVERVFSKEEIVVCRQAPHPAQSFSARFAAKEAFSKAIGTGFSRGVTPGNIHILGGERSAPTIVLTGRCAETARALGAGRIHVSLTHTADTAAAFVVVEYA